MASEGLHEPIESLRPETIDRHRAITSLMEELEAIDWYDQRVDATSDPDLRRVLAHNRDEEKEHAAMTLEWLRRQDPVLDQQLREWLFTDRVIGVDAGEGEGGTSSDAAAPTLGVGGLFGKGTL
jgi:ferritin-like protein